MLSSAATPSAGEGDPADDVRGLENEQVCFAD
jgi:hypothetical protein